MHHVITNRSVLQVTCHPYLCKGLEDDVMLRRVKAGESDRARLVVSPAPAALAPFSLILKYVHAEFGMIYCMSRLCTAESAMCSLHWSRDSVYAS